MVSALSTLFNVCLTYIKVVFKASKISSHSNNHLIGGHIWADLRNEKQK